MSHRLTLLLHERLVLQVELHVVDLIERLLRGFAFPDVGNDVSYDIFHSLIPDFSLTDQFLSQSLLYLPELHLVVIIALLEGGSRVCIVRVWVFPELAYESHSFLLISALFPVWNETASDEGAI